MEPVRKLHLRSKGMIVFSNAVLNADWPGLPKGVHLSLSYSPNDAYINLHVTKNAESQTNKPKVEIARVAKKEAEGIFRPIFQAVFDNLFVPFDMRPYQVGQLRSNWGARYISIMRLKNKRGYREVKRHFTPTFKKYAERKAGGKTLMIAKGIEQALFERVDMPAIVDFFFDQLKRIPTRFPAGADFGMLLAKDKYAFLMRFNNRWFKLQENPDPSVAFRECLKPGVYQTLVDQTLMAIEVVSKATTYDETKPYDNPILLTLEPGDPAET
jgi:hypothetical protein